MTVSLPTKVEVLGGNELQKSKPLMRSEVLSVAQNAPQNSRLLTTSARKNVERCERKRERRDANTKGSTNENKNVSLRTRGRLQIPQRVTGTHRTAVQNATASKASHLALKGHHGPRTHQWHLIKGFLT